MPFHSNTTQKTVVYSSPTWETQVVENNITLGSTLSTTAGIIDPLKISLGKYERVIGDVSLFYDSSNANELKFRFQNVDSDNAYVDTVLRYWVIGIHNEIANDAGAVQGDNTLEGGMNVDSGDHANTGQGSIIDLDAAGDQTPRAATIRFTAIGSEGKNGTLSCQVSGIAGTPTLLAGSYINYKRF